MESTCWEQLVDGSAVVAQQPVADSRAWCSHSGFVLTLVAKLVAPVLLHVATLCMQPASDKAAHKGGRGKLAVALARSPTVAVLPQEVL